MEKVTNGTYVSVDYKGTLDGGDVFDTSHGRQPIEIQMGAGQLIKGFEAALSDMELNEKKSFVLSPEEAYGQRDDSLTRDFPRKDAPEGMDPKVGQTVVLNSPEGQQIPAQITQADDEKITVDLNHPLAGKTLHFDIEVVGISATPTQQAAGCGGGCDCASDGCGSDGCGTDGCAC
jgi:peptidylprolyl isomerase